MSVNQWLLFLNSILADLYSYQFGSYNIFEIFLGIACVSVVTSAVVIRIKRGL